MASGKSPVRLALVSVMAVGALAVLDNCSSREPVRRDMTSSHDEKGDGSATRALAMGTDLQKRVQFTIENLGVIGATRCDKGRNVQRDTTKLVRLASADSLQTPTLAPSLYFTKSADEITVVISWVEDQPSLRQATVANPRTGKEVTVQVPEAYLGKIAARDSDGVVFAYLASIFVADLGGVSGDTLLIRETTRKGAGAAHCYPCVEHSPR